MRKNLQANKGCTHYMDSSEGMKPVPNAVVDSWYIISNFEDKGKILGLQWHVQTMDNCKAISVEVMLNNATDNICISNEMTAPASEKNGVDKDRIHVFCDWGELIGDVNHMTLKMDVPEGSINISIKPRDVLYNCATGFLPIAGGVCLQFAYPNMEVEGTVTIKGETYEVKNTTAWLDRQSQNGVNDGINSVAPTDAGQYHLSWLWLGLPLGEKHDEAISLWDSCQADGRYCFATIMKRDGSHICAPTNVTYDEIWTSSRSGNSYPKKVHVSLPSQELELDVQALVDDAEYVHEGINLAGCQVLSKVDGTYQGTKVDSYVLLELINDVCGELKQR